MPSLHGFLSLLLFFVVVVVFLVHWLVSMCSFILANSIQMRPIKPYVGFEGSNYSKCLFMQNGCEWSVLIKYSC